MEPNEATTQPQETGDNSIGDNDNNSANNLFRTVAQTSMDTTGAKVQLAPYRPEPQVTGDDKKLAAAFSVNSFQSDETGRTQESAQHSSTTQDDYEGASPSSSIEDSPPITVENMNWIECTRCGKWRLLEKEVNLEDLPEDWECSMNPDKNANTCTAPETDWQGQIEIRYGYTKEESMKGRKGSSAKKKGPSQQTKKVGSNNNASKTTGKKRGRAEVAPANDSSKKKPPKRKPSTPGVSNEKKPSGQANASKGAGTANRQAAKRTGAGVPPETPSYEFVGPLGETQGGPSIAPIGDGASSLVYRCGEMETKVLSNRDLHRNMQREAHHRFANSSYYQPQLGRAMVENRMVEPEFNKKTGNRIPISEGMLGDAFGDMLFEEDLSVSGHPSGAIPETRKACQQWFQNNDHSVMTDSSVRARLTNEMGNLYSSIRKDCLDSNSLCYEIVQGSPYQRVIEKNPNMKCCVDAFAGWLTCFRLRQIIGQNHSSTNKKEDEPVPALSNSEHGDGSLQWLSECWFTATDVVKEIEVWLNIQDESAFEGLSFNTFLALRTLCHPHMQPLCVRATEYRLGELEEQGWLMRSKRKPGLFRFKSPETSVSCSTTTSDATSTTEVSSSSAGMSTTSTGTTHMATTSSDTSSMSSNTAFTTSQDVEAKTSEQDVSRTDQPEQRIADGGSSSGETTSAVPMSGDE